jgi:hypothetical protein
MSSPQVLTSSFFVLQSIRLIRLSLNFLSFLGGTLKRNGPSKNTHAAIKAPANAIPKTWRIVSLFPVFPVLAELGYSPLAFYWHCCWIFSYTSKIELKSIP